MAYNEKFMRRCIELALAAADMGEVPVGACIVKDGEIIGEGFNRRETLKNPLSHAEIAAINEACRNHGDWRLDGCDLYVTLEPCPMCAGAIINARLKNVYFGAYDKSAGSFYSVVDLSELPFNHNPEIWGGMMQNECSALLKSFFDKIR